MEWSWTDLDISNGYSFNVFVPKTVTSSFCKYLHKFAVWCFSHSLDYQMIELTEIEPIHFNVFLWASVKRGHINKK